MFIHYSILQSDLKITMKDVLTVKRKALKGLCNIATAKKILKMYFDEDKRNLYREIRPPYTFSHSLNECLNHKA